MVYVYVHIERDEEKQGAAAILQYTLVAVFFYSKNKSVDETCGWRNKGEDRKRGRSKYMHREKARETRRERERERGRGDSKERERTEHEMKRVRESEG